MRRDALQASLSTPGLAVISLLIGVAATFAAARSGDALGPLLLVPYFVGAAFSGNLHSPDEMVAWGTVFLITTTVAFLALRWLARRVSSRER